MRDSQNFSDYKLYLYGTGIEDSPQQIVSLGNNKELLGACILPKSRGQLNQMGITVSEEHIKLLENWHLLKTEGEKLHTSITILSKERAFQLREHTRIIAPTIISATRREFDDFLQSLSGKYASYTYVLFFSYILDSLVWDRFMDRGLIKSWEVKSRKNLWVGTLWGSFLQRPFSPGTNTYEQKIKNVVSYTVWTEDLIPKLEPLFDDPEKISKLAEEYKAPFVEEQ